MRTILTNATLIDWGRGTPGDGALGKGRRPTPWQTLIAATKNAAAVCGAADDLGTVEVGKLADLIVVGANPLENIDNVRKLLLVLKEGRIVSDKRRAQERPSA